MRAVEKLMRGVVRFNDKLKAETVSRVCDIKKSPEVTQPQGLMFSCMDSRVFTSSIMQTKLGDMYLIRNAGNMIPHASCSPPHTTSTEPAALDFVCITNGIRDVVVCGHSDCKAMHGLNAVGDIPHGTDDSAMQTWVKQHGLTAIQKFRQLQAVHFKEPLLLNGENAKNKYEAFIDAENQFETVDKLSQVNCLLQVDNISSYGFLRDPLESDRLRLHAMWYDVHNADLYVFCRTDKKFTVVNNETCSRLLENSEKWYKDRMK